MLPAMAAAVALEDEFHGLLGVVHRELPAFECRGEKGLDALRVLLHDRLGRKQGIGVEVHAAASRREHGKGKSRLAQDEGFVGRVAGDRIYPPLDQVLRVEAVGKGPDAIDRHAFASQEGVELRLVRHDHQLATGKRMHRVADVLSHQQHQGRVLQDRGERDHAFSTCAPQRKFRCADAEVGKAREHCIDRVAAFAGLGEADLKSGAAVVALLDRGIKTGKLELVLPVQLHIDACGR